MKTAVKGKFLPGHDKKKRNFPSEKLLAQVSEKLVGAEREGPYHVKGRSHDAEKNPICWGRADAGGRDGVGNG